MNNKSFSDLFSELKQLNNNIKDHSFFIKNRERLKKKRSSDKLALEILQKNEDLSIEQKKIEKLKGECDTQIENYNRRITNKKEEINRLRGEKQRVNGEINQILSFLKSKEPEVSALKARAKELKGILDGNGNPPTPPPPPGPRNNNRRPENNLPSTPSSGLGSGAEQFALAANAALAKNRLNQSMKKKKNSVITNTTKPVKEQVKNWEGRSSVRRSLNGLSNRSPTKAGDAMRGARKKIGALVGGVRGLLPDKGKPEVKVESVNHRGAVAKQQGNAKARLNARKGTYANATRTNSSVPPPVTAPTGTSTSAKGTSAINQSRERAAKDTMVAPMRPNQTTGTKKVTGQSAVKILEEGAKSAVNMIRQTQVGQAQAGQRPNSARPFKGRVNASTNGNKNPARLIYGEGNSHQGLIKQASSKTGTALKMPEYVKKGSGSGGGLYTNQARKFNRDRRNGILGQSGKAWFQNSSSKKISQDTRKMMQKHKQKKQKRKPKNAWGPN